MPHVSLNMITHKQKDKHTKPFLPPLLSIHTPNPPKRMKVADIANLLNIKQQSFSALAYFPSPLSREIVLFQAVR